ncbi:hypothetical protein [Endozoicomonas sp. SCSIO W0465]|uniref:DUF6932 family protein n=1 Tax=Endozoicomonas TaxID=305899 RepID=UPI002075EFE3|nr:hypothetical protein [Endozoicomonas sp. SCSIO W0465]USE35853.1 hypothetical protein MJO57_27955 [Endozoicomonas sp. SCSIO W0465]
MDYPPLFAPGMHSITLSDMPEIFVAPFKNSSRRAHLLHRFNAFLESLIDFPVAMEIWIDGSFSTHKENPGDIDLLVVADVYGVNRLPARQQQQLFNVFESNEAIRLRYECDVIFVTDLQEDHTLWQELYGLDRNDRPKGIPKIRIGEAL